MGFQTKLINVSVAGQSGWTAPSSLLVPLADDSITVSRFVNSDPATRELQFETGSAHYRISITLRGSKVLAHYNGRQAFNGRTTSGMIHIAEPNTRLSAVIQSPGEALHLFLPMRTLVDLEQDMHRSGLELRKTLFHIDSSVGFLAQAIADNLLDADGAKRLYLDSLCTATVAKLISRFSNCETASHVASHGLSAWRLKKVREFINEYLDQPISLRDLADTAGLSQMHFASQFRQACGTSPHDYLLQCRVERAKDLLLNTRLTLLEIALAVGFRTHSHFTNTFKRVTGGTPAEWRKLRALSSQTV